MSLVVHYLNFGSLKFIWCDNIYSLSFFWLVLASYIIFPTFYLQNFMPLYFRYPTYKQSVSGCFSIIWNICFSTGKFNQCAFISSFLILILLYFPYFTMLFLPFLLPFFSCFHILCWLPLLCFCFLFHWFFFALIFVISFLLLSLD